MKKFKEFSKLDCKDEPLGDESKRFNIDSQEVFDSVTRKADEAEYKLSDAVRKMGDKLK